MLVDVETKSNKEIMEHVKKILGKNEGVAGLALEGRRHP